MENAEMVMTASLARQESRKAPYFKRSDFPEQDDKKWFAFSAIRLEKGRLRVSKFLFVEPQGESHTADPPGRPSGRSFF